MTCHPGRVVWSHLGLFDCAVAFLSIPLFDVGYYLGSGHSYFFDICLCVQPYINCLLGKKFVCSHFVALDAVSDVLTGEQCP